MVAKPTLKIKVSPRKLIAFSAGVLGLVGLLLIAQRFIDTNQYREQIIQAIKTQTGRTAFIKGKISISLVPTPTLNVPGLEIRDTEGTQAAPAIAVGMMKLHVPFSDMFSAHPHISGIDLEHPTLEMSRATDHAVHWQWLNLDLLRQVAAASGVTFAIQDGTILFHNNGVEGSLPVEHINVEAHGGKKFSASGDFSVYGHDLSFSTDTNAGDKVPASMSPLHVRINSGSGNAFDFKGGMDIGANPPKLDGNFSLELADVMSWVNRQQAEQALTKFIPSANMGKVAAQAPLPLKLTGEWVQENTDVTLDHVQLEGINSKGTASVKLVWNDWKPAVTADMDFSALDYLGWRRVIDAAFPPEIVNVSADNPDASGATGIHWPNLLIKNSQLSLHVKADHVTVGAQQWSNAKFAADFSEDTITVNQFNVELPGGSTLGLFGIISEGATGGMRFEGSVETAGKSLREMLTVFDASVSDLPETGFGAFHMRSNIFIASDQMRLSEADAKLSDLHLTGGLVAYFDSRPRVEADVKLKDINFDYFRDVWRQQQAKENKEEFFLKFDKNMNFNWLKTLQTNIDLKVNVDGFTFLERKGNSVSFRIYAKEGDFSVYDMHFVYPNDSVDLSFDLNVKKEQPAMTLVFNADQLNTDYFNLKPAPAGETAPPQPATLDSKALWSTDLIDMSWMDGFNASFDISVGKLTYGRLILNRLKFQSTLNDNLLTFRNFTFDYWQGRCSVLGAMYGGTVPGLSVSFTLYSAEMRDILKSLVGRENVSGKISISGTLTTSGVNLKSWVTQAQSKLVLAGRGVHVEGMNMQGVVNAVSVSRTAADVFNSVNLAFVNGSSDLSVDGTINIAGGGMKTPGIAIRTGLITGDLTGRVDLLPWTMDLTTLFQFPAITSETIPTMTVQLNGPISTPQLHTDTASLESYVAKRITSK